MPNYIRRYKKKRRRKRRRTYLRKYNPAPNLFSDRFRQTFRYVETIDLDPGLSGMAYHVFSANGLYDPDITGTGHQPLGFDQLVGITHNHYTVIASKIKCTFMSQDSASPAGQALVGIVPISASTPAVTSISGVLEQKRGKWGHMAQGNSMARKTISRKMNLSKFLGQKVLQEDANAGTVSANPTEQAFWAVMAGSVDEGTVNTSNLRVLCEIDYVAILHEPRLVAGS